MTSDGISQPFDENSSGFIRSEAICVVFLQKIDVARRNYVTIVNIGTANDGFKVAGAAVPSKEEIQKLQRKTYDEININPSQINFVESHAASTQVGDKIQVDCIDSVFCAVEREKPLKIGSVKSNTGHTESASGLVSLMKTIFMFENGKIIPNINIKQLRNDCDAFVEGRIEVAVDVEEFQDDIIGIDNFGILGANAHCVIKKNNKSKQNNGLPRDGLPRLLLWSGKTIDSVNHVYDNIVNMSIDDELMALLNKSQRYTNSTFSTRGFAILKSNDIENVTECLNKQIKELAVQEKRPIVYMYSGVGSQWLTMCKDLLKIPIIAEKLNECHRALESFDVNLMNLLTSDEIGIFDCCLNTFVAVIAIQIALTELLRRLELVPDYFIGHSLGELACAYADGCLSLEQTMRVAYLRGKCVQERCLKNGAMAAVSIKLSELTENLQNGIEIACYNSTNSFTVSGNFIKINKFVNTMTKNSVSVKLLDSSGIAFHSSHVRCCKDDMLMMLGKIIERPSKRSEKWISTSVNDENSINVSFASAEYFTNNLIHPVKFSDGLEKLPSNSLIIEVSPNSIFRGITKKMLPNCEFVSLTRAGAHDGVVHLLESIGKIFQSGVDLDVHQIYPEVKFPVSRGTRMIAPLIKWNHSESHFVPYFNPFEAFATRHLSINLYMPKYSYLSHHIIDGKFERNENLLYLFLLNFVISYPLLFIGQIIFPATGYMVIIWETFDMMHGRDYHNFSVCFENVKFVRTLILSKSKETNLTVNIQRGKGNLILFDTF